MTAGSDARKWDARYADADPAAAVPARVLSENLHLLPPGGDALEPACGLGANALLLAARGFRTRAWDISATALQRLAATAAAAGLGIETRTVDLTRHDFAGEQFDVIVVSRFLERAIIPALIDALRPGGLVYYQTFVKDSPEPGGPSNPAYRLACNELLQLFDSLQLLVYREEGRAGDVSAGFRGEAMLVARKP